jgi:hypothetical protein
MFPCDALCGGCPEWRLGVCWKDFEVFCNREGL